jgi:hypothetical protein
VSNPQHLVAPDPSSPNSQLTSWVPIYYLQSALRQAGAKVVWNGQDLQITPPASWPIDTANSVKQEKLSAGKMDFVVNGQAFEISPQKIAKDSVSGAVMTYIPVYYVNQFLNKQFSMQTNWDGTNWAIVTKDALVPQSVLVSVMGATTEKDDAGQHFVPFPFQIVTRDDEGGYLQAVGASRFPTADGLGQLVFFFHNGKVVGLNSNVEVTAIRSIQAAGTGKFVITYANYRPTDVMVNPTLPPQSVTYTWNGSAFTPSDALNPGVTLGNVEVTHSPV